MKKSFAITTIVSLHAIVIGILLAQSGCTEEPPATKASSQVTEIASGSEEIKEPKEVVPPEGSPALRSNPTRPNWNTANEVEVEAPAKPEAKETKITEISPDLTPIEPNKPATSTTTAKDSSTYVVKKGDYLSKISAKTGVSIAELCKANNLTTKSVLKIGQKLVIPTGENAPVNAPEAKPQNVQAQNISSELETYVVKKGDSLSLIASKHGTTVSHLKSINSLKNDNIRIGQKLQIEKGSAQKVKASATTSKKTVTAGEGEVLHTIKSGEKLAIIAKKYSISVKELCKINSITNPNKIRVGQVLKIKTTKAEAPKTEAKPTLAPVVAPTPKAEEKPVEKTITIGDEVQEKTPAPVATETPKASTEVKAVELDIE